MSQREEAALDQEVFDKTLAAELAKGTDRRVAEGRARSAAVRAYRKVHGEPEREQRAPAEREPAAAAAAAGAPSRAGDGGDGGVAAPAAAAVAAPGAPQYAPPPAAAVRTAPPPTGRAPSPRPGAPDKHRL